jgi:class 3 adenylate cyclase
MDSSEQKSLQLRQKERIEELRHFILVSTNWLSVPLFGLFSIADYFYAPDKFFLFAGLRLGILPSCLLVNSAVRRTRKLSSIQAWGALHVFVCALLITIMAFLAEGKSSPYYAGLNLIAILVGSFIPWTGAALAGNVALIYGPFFFLSVLQWHKHQNSIVLVNTCFMVATVVITVVIRHFNEQYRMTAIRSRIALDEELERRAQVIKEKSEEALSLAELAKQFSPQVVQAIRSGEMQISDSVKESEICVAFMDVSESTAAMQTVGVESYQNVMDMFIAVAVPILFKYDITYDKMIGDAILGFSNAPAKRTDYIVRMGAACLEIRDSLAARDEELSRVWGRPFRLKMGLASGIANVGFQGQIVRSYTATGIVVNTANRLCSIASPGQILFDGSSIRAFAARGFETAALGARTLKDIGEQTVYELEGFGVGNERWSELSAEACEKCGRILSLEENSSGILILKCSNCGHVHA